MKLKTKFQDEIFESGEVVDAFCYGEADRIRVNAYANDNERGEYIYYYNSIKDFTDHWEDALEEPKGIIKVEKSIFPTSVYIEYSTEEEAEKALEKLKAFTRLKDKGFRFEGWTIDDGLKISICTNMDSASEGIYEDDKEKLRSDLDTCFGGEE